MKYLIILAFSLMGLHVSAQSFFDAIGSGDADRVAQVMDTNVELCFDNKVDFMSKTQARKALSSFFKEHPPKSFTKKHNGNSPGADSKYWIGDYIDVQGKQYRVYIFAKKEGAQQYIQELRFDQA